MTILLKTGDLNETLLSFLENVSYANMKNGVILNLKIYQKRKFRNTNTW